MDSAIMASSVSGGPRGEAGRAVLRARRGWQPIDLQDLWRYRDLLWFLALRDIQVRYKQTVLGVAWAVLQPVASMVVFAVFFGYLGGIGKRIENGIPYAIYTFVALLPWQLFASSVTNAGNSLISNQNLISKVYFPRLIVPVAAMGASLVDFLVAAVVMVVLMAWYGVAPGVAAVTLPLFILLAVGTAMAAALWLSALNVAYRDVRYVIPFLVQFWLLASPVAYPTSIVPEKWRLVYGLNPMVGVIDGFRWAVLGKAEAPGGMVWVSVVVTGVLLVGGLLYFRRMERTFADLV